jgi:hypothetical protein
MKTRTGGRNVTGIATAPELARLMTVATREFPPSSKGDASGIAEVRAAYARRAEPIGSMPVGTGGPAATLLLDKLGERLAFENAGTRLYEAIISKHDAGCTFRGAPSRAELTHIRDEEHEHFLMVANAIRGLGGDPTMMTPSANVQAIASKGLPAVVTDARTDLLQCLEAVLTAELVDNDCWSALIELAEAAGQDRLATRFREALEHEREHLENVRAWVAAGMGRSVERGPQAGRETRRKPLRAEAKGSGRLSARRRVSRGAKGRTKRQRAR